MYYGPLMGPGFGGAGASKGPVPAAAAARPPPPPPPPPKPSGGCGLLRTSLTYQTSQFFELSTLHGVRYIREEGRPLCERLMWFVFTTVGGVATLIIISSLWEKFQTNPTITGLDTDFHNWDVPFPGVSLCLLNPADEDKIKQATSDEDAREFLRHVANFSYRGLPAFKSVLDKPAAMLREKTLAEYQLEVSKPCSSLFLSCEFRGQNMSCCSIFLPMATEMGFCYVFNSRLAYRANKKDKDFQVEYIRETDEKWSLDVKVKQMVSEDGEIQPIELYIQSNDEAPIKDVSAQHQWRYRLNQLSFSAKQTYTTEEARQLTIKQRRCVFPDEIRLDTDSMYTYTSCMMQCRMRRSRDLCGCVPFFYTVTKGYKICTAEDIKCLVNNIDKLNSVSCKCELGCMNTVYEVEKMEDSSQSSDQPSIEMKFVSWPIVRYKREVLFGWVDLLVSFGGIAGLFLGFSLLSGVEIVYYFTMRACCMLVRNKDDLRRLQHEFATAPRPPLDLSLTPYCLKAAQADGRPLVPPAAAVAAPPARISVLGSGYGGYGGQAVLRRPAHGLHYLP